MTSCIHGGGGRAWLTGLSLQNPSKEARELLVEVDCEEIEMQEMRKFFPVHLEGNGGRGTN